MLKNHFNSLRLRTLSLDPNDFWAKLAAINCILLFLFKLNLQVTFEFAIITLILKTWQDMNGKRFFFFIPFRIGKGKSLYIQEKKNKTKTKNERRYI